MSAEVHILGTRFATMTFEQTIARLLDRAGGRGPFRAHFANVHTTVDAHGEADLRRALDSADMVLMDGMPLVWIARRRGHPYAERVAGPDVMLAMCDRGRAAGLRHFFFGGGPGVADELARRLVSRYPGLQVAGAMTPPFRAEASVEEERVIARINEVAPNVLWVALGAPKQELWAALNAGRLRAGVVLPVGAAFDFHSGRIRRAPEWMQRIGLEWLFRLGTEPRRLAGRYLRTNARFLWLLIRERSAGAPSS